MKITIEGNVKEMSSWTTFQEFLRELTGNNGKLTRIFRPDRNVNYRAKGEYEATFRTTKGEDILIEIKVS